MLELHVNRPDSLFFDLYFLFLFGSLNIGLLFGLLFLAQLLAITGIDGSGCHDHGQQDSYQALHSNPPQQLTMWPALLNVYVPP